MGLRYRDARVPPPEPVIDMEMVVTDTCVTVKANNRWTILRIGKDGFLTRYWGVSDQLGFPCAHEGRIQLDPDDPAAIALKRVAVLEKVNKRLRKFVRGVLAREHVDSAIAAGVLLRDIEAIEGEAAGEVPEQMEE